MTTLMASRHGTVNDAPCIHFEDPDYERVPFCDDVEVGDEGPFTDEVNETTCLNCLHALAEAQREGLIDAEGQPIEAGEVEAETPVWVVTLLMPNGEEQVFGVFSSQDKADQVVDHVNDNTPPGFVASSMLVYVDAWSTMHRLIGPTVVGEGE